MTKRIVTLAVFMAALAVDGAARAQSGSGAEPMMPAGRLERLSQMLHLLMGPDGRVEIATIRRRRQERFDRLDQNGDGFVDQDELRGGERAALRSDFNFDGRLNRVEFTEMAMALMTVIDQNVDGMVTASEVETARNEIARRRGNRSENGGMTMD